MIILCRCIKLISILGIILWVIFALFFLQWKNLYYYPQYDLFLYVDGGIIGNRTVILGQSLESMNTILRYDSRDVFNFYIGKSEERFYIYWPEDTTSCHYSSVKGDCPNSTKSFDLQEVKYIPFLKHCSIDSRNVSLVTFLHQTPENWIDTYKAWSDTLHWGSPGQLKIYFDTRIDCAKYSNSYDTNSDGITIGDCDARTYMKLFIKALDKDSIAFIVTLFLWVIVYVLCLFWERHNRT